MLTDNLEYLTDEERGWREETVKLSSTRPVFGWFRRRIGLVEVMRLLAALDRLAYTRARLDNRSRNAQLEEQQNITELEQQLAYYKGRVENEQHAAENLENCHLHVGANSTQCEQCGLDITDNIHHPVLVEFKNCKQQLTQCEGAWNALKTELEVARQRLAELGHEPEAPVRDERYRSLSDRSLFPTRRLGGHL